MLDKFLFLFGTIGALCAGGLYPLVFLAYGQVAGSFVILENTNISSFKNEW